MKFFIDAHLPASLSSYFDGHDVLHGSALPDGNLTSDQTISQLASQDSRALIIKDSDFYHSYIAFKKPPKLVLVKLGNMRLRELHSYFRNNAGRIIELLQDHYFLILERDTIRVLQ